MTAQQIEYWKLKEQSRANLATEAENVRYHKRAEELQSQVNAETKRHNLALEAINHANMTINARNAAVNELNAATNARLATLTAQRDAETARHNAALEAIQKNYNETSLALTGQKIWNEYDLGLRQVSSKEQIASLDRTSKEGIESAKRSNEMTIAVLNASNSALQNAAKVAPTLATVGGVAAGAKVTRDVLLKGASYVNPHSYQTAPLTHSPKVNGAATSGSSSATTLAQATGLAGAAGIIGAAMAGGLLIGAVLDKTNPSYPGNPNKDAATINELKKGVKYYGSE